MLYQRPKTFFYKILVVVFLLILPSYPLHTSPYYPLRNTLKTKKMIRNQIEFLNKRLEQSKKLLGNLYEVKEEADENFYGLTGIFSVVSLLIFIYSIRGMNKSFIQVQNWYPSSILDPESQRSPTEKTLSDPDPLDRIRVADPTMLNSEPALGAGYHPLSLLDSPYPTTPPDHPQGDPDKIRPQLPAQPDHKPISVPVDPPEKQSGVKLKKKKKKKNIKRRTNKEILLQSLLPYKPDPEAPPPEVLSPSCQQLGLKRNTTFIAGILSPRTNRAIIYSFLSVPLTFAGIIAAIFDDDHRKYKDTIEKTVGDNNPVFVIQPLYNRFTHEFQLTVTRTPINYPSSVPDARRQSIDQFFYKLMESFRSREKQINDLYQNEQKRLDNEWYHAGTWGLQRSVKFINTVILAEKERQKLYEQEISTLRNTLDQLRVQ